MIARYMKFIELAKDYISKLKNDIRKIVWPERQRTLVLFIIAVVMCAVFAVFIMYIDLFISKIMKFLLMYGNK